VSFLLELHPAQLCKLTLLLRYDRVRFACALVIAGYALPLLVGIGATRDDLDEWKEGHFSRVAKELGGTWLEM